MNKKEYKIIDMSNQKILFTGKINKIFIKKTLKKLMFQKFEHYYRDVGVELSKKVLVYLCIKYPNSFSRSIMSDMIFLGMKVIVK